MYVVEYQRLMSVSYQCYKRNKIFVAKLKQKRKKNLGKKEKER